MSNHVAMIEWRSDGEFLSGRYSRLHDIAFDGGASIPGSSSPSVVPEPMSDSAAIDPEELLVASVSSCHMLWFLSLAQNAGLDVLTYSDRAEGEMGWIGPGRMAVTRIVLKPDVAFVGRQPDSAELDRLHHEAHERCFIANSLSTDIVVEAASPAEG